MVDPYISFLLKFPQVRNSFAKVIVILAHFSQNDGTFQMNGHGKIKFFYIHEKVGRHYARMLFLDFLRDPLCFDARI